MMHAFLDSIRNFEIESEKKEKEEKAEVLKKNKESYLKLSEFINCYQGGYDSKNLLNRVLVDSAMCSFVNETSYPDHVEYESEKVSQFMTKTTLLKIAIDGSKLDVVGKLIDKKANLDFCYGFREIKYHTVAYPDGIEANTEVIEKLFLEHPDWFDDLCNEPDFEKIALKLVKPETLAKELLSTKDNKKRLFKYVFDTSAKDIGMANFQNGNEGRLKQIASHFLFEFILKKINKFSSEKDNNPESISMLRYEIKKSIKLFLERRVATYVQSKSFSAVEYALHKQQPDLAVYLIKKGGRYSVTNLQNKEKDQLYDILNNRIICRLLVGDGNFSFAVALSKKHSSVKNTLIATEIKSEKQLIEEDKKKGDTSQKFVVNKKYLDDEKVEVKFEVDGRDLQKSFPNRRFQRIYFNFPHEDKSSTTRQLPVLLTQFFKSASTLQKPGDRVHMGLVKGHSNQKPTAEFYLGYTYGILNASIENQYKLILKRKFHVERDGKHRYPDYGHATTSPEKNAEIVKTLGREFIFEKTFSKPIEIWEDLKKNNKIAKANVYSSEVVYPINYDTDNDSDGYNSDEELEVLKDEFKTL